MVQSKRWFNSFLVISKSPPEIENEIKNCFVFVFRSVPKARGVPSVLLFSAGGNFEVIRKRERERVREMINAYGVGATQETVEKFNSECSAGRKGSRSFSTAAEQVPTNPDDRLRPHHHHHLSQTTLCSAQAQQNCNFESKIENS